MTLLLAAASSAEGQAAKVDLPTASYAELGKTVRSLRGKVVVVYFWADY